MNEQNKNGGWDWHCKKHNTFGDRGWSCAECGYPLGAKNIIYEKGKVWNLKRIIDCFFFTIFVYETIEI